jgi:UDP-galactopyranose mutase
VHFVGRLATYRYYNMDQVVAQALTLVDRLLKRERIPDFLTASASDIAAKPTNGAGSATTGSGR